MSQPGGVSEKLSRFNSLKIFSPLKVPSLVEPLQYVSKDLKPLCTTHSSLVVNTPWGSNPAYQ